MSRSARERGFTLLEAIIAVAVVGLAVVAMMTFVSQIALQLTAAGEAVSRSTATQAALDFLEPLNPVEDPEGRAELGDLTVQWASTAIVPATTEVRVGTGLAGYGIGFFAVDVTVYRNDGEEEQEWFTFALRKVGYRNLINPAEQFGFR
jgi:general secretion pathway protein I